jgi:hypothetical protein
MIEELDNKASSWDLVTQVAAPPESAAQSRLVVVLLMVASSAVMWWAKMDAMPLVASNGSSAQPAS